ncbi:hypothetical protein [Mesorhizobium ventifaucium]|uniref:Uncharacterized protein n=1 Tax=Mesorhizobium ventifaucium TaxID=666020 RepID=A0ABN8K9F7_9HYPH|nr:hypothetical protein MES4922_490029 [Mesorhizobium ventifaucium]
MSLAIHRHPLASFCWKPLIAVYENGTPFTFVGNEQSRATTTGCCCGRLSPA